MAIVLKDWQRVQRYLRRQAKKRGYDFSDAPDPRQQGKVRIPRGTICWALLLGMLGGRRSGRTAESLTKKLEGWARTLVPQPISDTTLHTEAARLDDAHIIDKLVQQIRGMNRDRVLRPCNGLLGTATCDGKNAATLDHDGDGRAHERSSENEKWHDSSRPKDSTYFLVPVLRCTLTSAVSKPCIYQMAIEPGTGESTAFPTFVDRLDSAYGRSGLIELIDGDAGLCSLGNADHVDSRGYLYLLGLKGNQPELFEAAQVVLYARLAQYAPEAVTDWECRDGKKIRRLLWRSPELKGFENSVGSWDHLEQVWLVRQETKDSKGVVAVEDRFFVTSIPWKRLNAHQILTTVRNHWGVENDSFHSLDVQWLEDSGAWCTQGNAVWGLGALRLIALNIVQYLRKRHLCKKRKDGSRGPPETWSETFELICDALKREDTTAGGQPTAVFT